MREIFITTELLNNLYISGVKFRMEKAKLHVPDEPKIARCRASVGMD